MRCNLSCSFCDTTYRHQKSEDELSLAEWLTLIDQAVHAGVQQFYVLGGGEPFVKRGIIQILRAIKSHKCYGMLTTNGSLIDHKTSDSLIEMRWDEIHISIDGDNAATHDDLRGQKGSFRKAVQTACRLSTIDRHFAPRIVLHTVITNKNYTQLTGLINLAHALKAKRVDFDSLIAYHPKQQSLILSNAQIRELKKEAQRAKLQAQNLGIEHTLDNFISQERPQRGIAPPKSLPKEGKKGAPCLKPWHHLVVGHNGKTAPCCVLSGEGPSIKNQSFMEFWTKDKYFEQLRNSMRAHNPTKRCAECSWNILRHEREIRAQLLKS